jgi:HD-GYP domain-containing protein (c-di-GMP phosphodiesterase class II)/DNA-binding CsgD family transcriptional regulator
MERIRLAELCATTSLFTDLGSGQPVEHGLRTCLVAMRLADRLGCDPAERRDVLYVSLLRFLGCTAGSHELVELGGGDERHILAGMARVTMGSSVEELLHMVRIAAPGASRAQRARVLLAALADTDLDERLLAAHCEAASRLAADMGLPPTVQQALAHGFARWDGDGVPGGVEGEDVPLALRISVVARDIELWARDADDREALKTLRARRGRAYDPQVVDAALDTDPSSLRRTDGDLWDEVVSLEPAPPLVVGDTALDDALRALGDFGDLKHPSLSGQSRRVERIVVDACRARGLDGEDGIVARRGASVHEVGVVAVPGRAFEPRGAGAPAMTEQLRLHPAWSERLLARCPGLEAVATLAGRHHERIDGSGYPAGLAGDLGPAAGLLAGAVAYEACRRADGRDGDAARKAAAESLSELAREGRLTRADASAVIEAVGERAPLIEVDRPAGLTEREVQVLRLLATGCTNRRISAELGISVKTVGAHVEHIYDKTGVGSRAGATLFAAQNDLLS